MAGGTTQNAEESREFHALLRERPSSAEKHNHQMSPGSVPLARQQRRMAVTAWKVKAAEER